jgi:geranylgeranyl transferase type-2 subunit alpha
MNPEFYTAWNCRREILSAILESLLDNEHHKYILKDLELVNILLRNAPKSYWLWNHRRWLLDQSRVPLWGGEIKLVNYMLDLDARNFHGWDYRRYVIKESKCCTPEEDFSYTSKKIAQNFSNFSAWHYRSKLLPVVCKDAESLQTQIAKG